MSECLVFVEVHNELFTFEIVYYWIIYHGSFSVIIMVIPVHMVVDRENPH